MKLIRVLCADEGMVLTDGTFYGTVVYLADDADVNSYYEITEEEYEAILAEQEQEQASVAK